MGTVAPQTGKIPGRTGEILRSAEAVAAERGCTFSYGGNFRLAKTEPGSNAPSAGSGAIESRFCGSALFSRGGTCSGGKGPGGRGAVLRSGAVAARPCDGQGKSRNRPRAATTLSSGQEPIRRG